MRSLVLLATLPLVAATCDKEKAGDGAVPSGFTYVLQEALSDQTPDGKHVLRLRYVSDQIGQSEDSAQLVVEDFAALCLRDALPKNAQATPKYDQAVISLANKKSEFGVFNPDVIQYFEAFTLQNDTCIWEAF